MPSAENSDILLPTTEHVSKVVGTKFKSEGKTRARCTQACVFCKKSHMHCDGQRPCSRCVKRRIGHLCVANGDTTKPKDNIHDIKGTASRSTLESYCQPAVASQINETQIDHIYGEQLFNDVNVQLERPLPYIAEIGSTCAALQDIIIRYTGSNEIRLESPGSEGDKNAAASHAPISVIHKIAVLTGPIRDFHRRHIAEIGPMALAECEQYLQHRLLAFQPIFATITTPILLTRTSGEILCANDSFFEMLFLRREDFFSSSDNTRYFHNLITTESFLNLMEKFTGIYLNSSAESLMTNCTFTPSSSGNKMIRTCVNLTIQRDQYSVPMLLIYSIIPV